MSLLGLSNELLDRIFSFCEKDSIKCSRLANRRLRNAANRHLIQELRLYYNQESLDILDSLATTHSDMAKGITAFWLQTDRLQERTRDSWETERLEQFERHSILSEGWDHELESHGFMEGVSGRPETPSSNYEARISINYLDRGYSQYRELYSQQCALDRSDALREKCTAFFRVAPKLSGIWVTSGGSVRDNTTHYSAAFRKGMRNSLH